MTGLTERQSRIAELVALGHSNKQIAGMLGSSPPCISQTLQRIIHRWRLDPSLNSRVLIARRVLGAEP